MPKPYDPKPRLEKILAARAAGKNFKEIGIEFGVSTGRARQLWVNASRARQVANLNNVKGGKHERQDRG